MPEYDYDLFVIGAGSGGVRASRVSAAYGARVAVAEEYRVGGTCVIRGCVPKKLLVYGAHFAEDLRDARRFGWNVPDCDFDWPTLRDNVMADVDRLNGLYTQTLTNNAVEMFLERATVTGTNEVTLASGKKVTAKYILIATGAHPHVPDFPGAEHGITSNEVFHLEKLPKRILIAGGGYIANEFAGIFNEFGCHVTLVNRTDVLHWHSDTFGLPAGTELLASTDICRHQAFALGRNVLGLQFNGEADAADIERWLIGHACEIAATGLDLRRLRADSAQHGSQLREVGVSVFADWLAGLDRPRSGGCS